MFRKIIKRAVFGRLSLQPLFFALQRLSLRGMNIGGGSDVSESGERRVLERVAAAIAGRPVVIFDVGANVGDYALMANEVFGGRAVIHCFEPSQTTFEQLQRRCGSFARLNRFGMSDEATAAMLYASPQRSGLSSVYERKLDHIDLQMQPSETVSLRTLDGYCSDQSVPRVDLLKLDVEGHELAVLKGAKNLLDAGRIDIIQFEFGGCNIDSRTYFRDFFHLLVPRFRLYRILSNGLWPVDHYDETMEAFSTTNYLAVRSASDVRL